MKKSLDGEEIMLGSLKYVDRDPVEHRIEIGYGTGVLKPDGLLNRTNVACLDFDTAKR